VKSDYLSVTSGGEDLTLIRMIKNLLKESRFEEALNSCEASQVPDDAGTI